MKNLSSIFIDHEPLEKIPAILFHDPSWCNLIEHQEDQELESIQENQELFLISWTKNLTYNLSKKNLSSKGPKREQEDKERHTSNQELFLILGFLKSWIKNCSWSLPGSSSQELFLEFPRNGLCNLCRRSFEDTWKKQIWDGLEGGPLGGWGSLSYASSLLSRELVTPILFPRVSQLWPALGFLLKSKWIGQGSFI